MLWQNYSRLFFEPNIYTRDNYTSNQHDYSLVLTLCITIVLCILNHFKELCNILNTHLTLAFVSLLKSHMVGLI